MIFTENDIEVFVGGDAYHKSEIAALGTIHEVFFWQDATIWAKNSMYYSLIDQKESFYSGNQEEN